MHFGGGLQLVFLCKAIVTGLKRIHASFHWSVFGTRAAQIDIEPPPAILHVLLPGALIEIYASAKGEKAHQRLPQCSAARGQSALSQWYRWLAFRGHFKRSIYMFRKCVYIIYGILYRNLCRDTSMILEQDPLCQIDFACNLAKV